MNPKERAVEVLAPWEKYNKSFLDDTKDMLKSRIEAQISLAVMVAVKNFQSPVSGQFKVDALYEEIGDVWVRPTPVDALRFTHQELGELDDAMMRAGYSDRLDYSRNRDKDADTAAVERELGDVQLMLCSLASALDLDLGTALQHRINFYRNKYAKEVPDEPWSDEQYEHLEELTALEELIDEHGKDTK